MNANIHPTYYSDCVVTCSCGNTFVAGSTKQKIKVEICSACHPFYTGTQKFVDTVGNIDRFQAKVKAAAVVQQAKVAKKEEKKRDEFRPRTLKEMLMATKNS